MVGINYKRCPICKHSVLQEAGQSSYYCMACGVFFAESEGRFFMLCPECKHSVLQQYGDSWHCMSCNEDFVIKDGRFQKRREAVTERVKGAKESYEELNIKHLKKSKVIEIAKEAGYNIEVSDLEGAIIHLPNVNVLREVWGVRAFPLTIYIPRKKWNPTKFRDSLGRGNLGFSIPLRKMKNISLNFMVMPEDRKFDIHEDLHGVFLVYKLASQGIENYFLNEIFAYRANVKRGELNWDDVKRRLQDVYLPKWFDPNKSPGENKAYRERIGKACDQMKELEKHYTQKQITMIILRCRNLDDLIGWGMRIKIKKSEFEKEIQKIEAELGWKETEGRELEEFSTIAEQGKIKDWEEEQLEEMEWISKGGNKRGEEGLKKLAEGVKKTGDEKSKSGEEKMKKLLKKMKGD